MVNSRFLIAGLLLCLASPALPAADPARTDAETPLKIVRLWTHYRDAASFARRGHFRKTDEEPGDAIILRSQPDARDGFYFTVRARARGGKSVAVPDGKVVLHVISPDAAHTRVFEFPYAAGRRSTVQLLLGVTGADWTHGETMPLAWKLEFVGRDGAVLARQESYLWRKP